MSKSESGDVLSATLQISPLRDPTISFGSKAYLVIKTLVFLLAWITSGISMACHGVALPDFLPRVGANYETISRAMSFGYLTQIVGCAISMMCDRFTKWTDLVLSGGFLVCCICFSLLPWMRSLPTFGIVYCLYKLGTSIIYVVSVYSIANMWKSASAFPLQFVHLGFGIGGFIAPLIALQFLSPDGTDTNTTMVTIVNATTQTLYETVHESNCFNGSLTTNGERDCFLSTIEDLYFIVGGMLLLSSLLFLGYQIFGKPNDLHQGSADRTNELKSRKSKIILSPLAWSPESLVFGVTMLVGMICFFSGLIGNDGTIRLFLFSFALNSDLNIGKQEAAFIDSAYNISFTIGRGISAVLSIFVPMHVLFFIELSGVVVAGFCLSFFLYTNVHFWVFVCFYGVMIGSNWPAGLAWAAKYIKLTATFIAIMHTFNCLVMFGLYWLTGYLFDKVGPMTIMYFCLSCACFSLIAMIILQIIAHFRHSKKLDNVTIDVTIDQLQPLQDGESI